VQTYNGKIMITMMGVNFHFSMQFVEKVIEKVKNEKNEK